MTTMFGSESPRQVDGRAASGEEQGEEACVHDYGDGVAAMIERPIRAIKSRGVAKVLTLLVTPGCAATLRT